MENSILDLEVNHKESRNSETTLRNLLELKDVLHEISDSQRILILQRLTYLLKDKSFTARNKNHLETINALVDSIATSISDDFIMRAFGIPNINESSR